MDAERKEFFRKLLEQRLNSLLQGAGAALGTLTEESETPADHLDIATQESNRDFGLRLQDRERHLIGKIKAALQRIDDDEYGVCVSCGDDISERRLMARPVATHCIDCKTEAEQLERHKRAF